MPPPHEYDYSQLGERVKEIFSFYILKLLNETRQGSGMHIVVASLVKYRGKKIKG